MKNNDLDAQLKAALQECARLREENAKLRGISGISEEKEPPPAYSSESDFSSAVTNNSPVEAKIALFRSLFRGREDVYPVRWEGRAGRSGYSPVCANQKNRVLCSRPKIKCAHCPNRKLLPVTDQVIFDHLAGKHTIGVYPLLPDETCWFLAVDFDKAAWQDDAAMFLEVCRNMGVPAVLERSRSGNGAHIWIFFDCPLPAFNARKLGCAILTHTLEMRYQVDLDSYDRFFPNQDTMPKGGFGNLIALPLQAYPREMGNSVFLSPEFQVYQDQWSFLYSIRKMSPGEVQSIIHEAERTGNVIAVHRSLADEEGDDPWTLPPSGRKAENPIPGPFPKLVRIVLGNMVYVEKEGLPSGLINRLVCLAAFQNPEFYRTQAMRLSTFSKPRVIRCMEEFPHHLGLPRGCLEDTTRLLKAHGIKVAIKDERFAGIPIEVNFMGELKPRQKEAAKALLDHDIGILAATTAFGKTVVAAWLIAARKINTLVLVHRRYLLEQWRQRLSIFLDMPQDAIGQIGGGQNKPTGIIDVAVIQSLNRKGEVKDMVADYGHVVVDECHHISAFSFEQVLKQAKARYVTGLTATPVRKDGHHPIIIMQCGPIRFRVRAKGFVATSPMEHLVIPRYTEFEMSEDVEDPAIYDIYASLIIDKQRNAMILADLLKALETGRSPLLLTERTEHVIHFAERLKGVTPNVIVLKGGMGKKQRKAVAEQLVSIPDSEKRVIVATGRYIGEGFDDHRLDTLFLVMPISWRGTLQQYVGRLHRIHHNKRVVQVYDYIDARVPVLSRMYQKRLKGYKALGYAIEDDNVSD